MICFFFFKWMFFIASFCRVNFILGWFSIETSFGMVICCLLEVVKTQTAILYICHIISSIQNVTTFSMVIHTTQKSNPKESFLNFPEGVTTISKWNFQGKKFTQIQVGDPEKTLMSLMKKGHLPGWVGYLYRGWHFLPQLFRDWNNKPII